MSNGNSTPDLKLDAPGSALDLEQLWYVLREKAWLIVLCGLLGIFAGLAFIHHTSLTYYAQAVIEVDPEPVKVVGYTDTQDQKDPISDQMGQTLLATFRSRAFAQKVIENYKLLNNPVFMPPRPDGKAWTMDESVGALIGMSQVTLRMGTRFLDVGARHSNPEMAKQLADMLANTYIEQTKEERRRKAKDLIDYLADQANKASTALSQSSKDLQDYVNANGFSLVEAHDTVNSDLKNKNTDLSTAQAELIRLETDDEEIQKHQDDPQALLNIPTVANDPSIMADRHAVNEIEGKIELLKLRYTERHPKMIQARTQLANATQNLNGNVLKIPAMVHDRLMAAKQRAAKFGSAVAAQTDAAMKQDDKRIQLDVLSRKKETDQALYDSILNNVKQAGVATGIDSTGVYLFESAQVPMEPLQARKSKVLAISVAGGLVLGIIMALGLHFMDSSVKSVDQAEEVFGLTVLAAIPRQAQKRLREGGLTVVNAPASEVAEAFRSLRTSVYLAGRRAGRRIVLFTSALASEGKTFCSTNYAASLAQQGLRTLIIDADLRSPMIGKVLLNGEVPAGLAELLKKTASLDEAIHATELENLWVMPAGKLVPNPAELLAQGGMTALMAQLEDKFERVVIDTAPVTAVSDTLLLLEHAQTICLVFHAGKTPRKWILRTIKLISEAGSKPSGVIVNQVPMQMAGAYSYYPGRYGEPSVYGAKQAREAAEALRATTPSSGG